MKTIEFTKAYLESAAGVKVDDIYDDIMILFHNSSAPSLAKLSSWEALQKNGQVATGVVVFSGEKQLVIAPNSSGGIAWSSSYNVAPSATMTTNPKVANADWKGAENTAAIIAAATPSFITNTATYAPGFCNLYSRLNIDGYGIGEGNWWLPSFGELQLIYANLKRINYALNLIGDAELIPVSAHWSSTQLGSDRVWCTLMSHSLPVNPYKASARYIARPVSALQ